MKIKKLYTFLFVMLAAIAMAQQKPVQASIDSVKIKIGSQANLLLKATVDTAARVRFPEGKNFGQLEVLESYPVDTVKKGALYELVKKYGLTQFDSGSYTVPRLPVVINNKTLLTDSLKLEVANIKVDTLQQKMYDIKPVMAYPSSNSWWIWVVAAAALGALAFGVWWYLKKRKKKALPEEQVFASPIEKATAQLQNLEKKELLQRGEVKDYYSELTDIARTYIEEAIHIPAMESTTGELIEGMRRAVQQRKMSLTQETFEELEKLPGVGHKTASVVMSQGFGYPAFAVDTHIHRLAQRWGLTSGKNVVQTEKDLKRIFPKTTWSKLHLQIIFYGGEYCKARECYGVTCKICTACYPNRKKPVITKKA